MGISGGVFGLLTTIKIKLMVFLRLEIGSRELLSTVRQVRIAQTTKAAQRHAHIALGEVQAVAKEAQILAFAAISSENREYLPVLRLFGKNIIASNKVFALYDAPILEHGAGRITPSH